MKKIILCLVAIIAIELSSCKKKDDPTVGFSEEIQKIVPDEILKDVRAKGMVINEGKVPPNIEGNYIVEPVELLSPFGQDDPWRKGKIIDDYYYKFSRQSSDKKTVFIDYNNGGTDRGSGLGSFVSGNGNKFTIFSEVVGTGSGVDYVMLQMFSGELTADKEIKNFQLSIYMKEKDESSGLGVLIPLNTGRIWFDNNKISKRTSTYYENLRKASTLTNKGGFAGTSK